MTFIKTNLRKIPNTLKISEGSVFHAYDAFQVDDTCVHTETLTYVTSR